MAVGDEAVAVGFDVVPDSGENGRLRWGGREINRTRDYVAEVLNSIPLGNAANQTAAGISFGTGSPSGGNDGDIYFQIVAPTP